MGKYHPLAIRLTKTGCIDAWLHAIIIRYTAQQVIELSGVHSFPHPGTNHGWAMGGVPPRIDATLGPLRGGFACPLTGSECTCSLPRKPQRLSGRMGDKQRKIVVGMLCVVVLCLNQRLPPATSQAP